MCKDLENRGIFLKNTSDIWAYFVSDVHLAKMDEARAVSFLTFLKRLGRDLNVTHLFLVGDIFDLWIADHPYFINQYSSVIEEIQRLIHAQVEVHYFEGNHDLYLLHFWQKQLGVQVHRGPTYFHLGDLDIRVEHGDQVDPDDKGYLFLRWLLRTPVMKWIALHLPEKLVVAIGEKASRKSRVYTSVHKTIDKNLVQKKLRVHMEKAYKKAPFQLLISGHTHVASDILENFNGQAVRSINLGTWLDKPQVFAFSKFNGKKKMDWLQRPCPSDD